jgi:methyl-accepting chemotaxis protein
MKTIGGTLKKNATELSQSVEDQAASVHETSASINEITSMVNRTTENSKESRNIAQNSSQKAEEGQKIMNELVQSMETIHESNKQLQNISSIIGQIQSKTAVINDIVSKTELLSLNASIESARAGEHGKGFAVVAEEVGNLAKVSGKSAQEIQELITKSQEQVNKILEMTQRRVDEGKQVTAVAQKTFHTISNDIQALVLVLEHISEANHEQEIGITQISTAMSQIDKVTQKNQENSLRTFQSSEEVSKESGNLEITSTKIEKLITGKTS